jgi:protein-S-isoprenylcysteine O-methyltransferase Ste14
MTEFMSAADNAGVRFPPPIVYVAAIAGGAVLQKLRPLPVGGGGVRIIVAWLCVALWAAVMLVSFYSFWSRRTSIVPVRPATALVEAGPYRFTRNPMYLSLVLLALGVGLWMNTWWVIVLLVPAVVVIDRFVIAREEAYLRRRFGGAYDAYTRRVRRWL